MKKKNIVIIGISIIIILLTIYGIIIFGNNYSESKNNEVIKVEDGIKENQDLDKADLKTKEYLENFEKNDKEYNSKNNEYKKDSTFNASDKVEKSSAADKKNDAVYSENNFNINKAIDICKSKYGNDSDIEYSTNGKIENLNGQSGYLVKVKSKSLMKSGGTGILFTVLVSSDGQVTELE